MLLSYQPARILLLLTSESRNGRWPGCGLRYSIEVVGNFILIVGLIVYGSKLFAEYHSRGKWAKNVTGLLAGLGLFLLPVALAPTEEEGEGVVEVIAHGRAPPLPD